MQADKHGGCKKFVCQANVYIFCMHLHFFSFHKCRYLEFAIPFITRGQDFDLGGKK